MIWASAGSALLFGLAANTDNLTVGLAYGVQRRGIPLHLNLLIACVTTAITLLALSAGLQVRQMLPPAMAGIVGGFLLIALAAWSFWRRPPGAEMAPEAGARDSQVRFGESLVLAFALSVNNIGLAIGEGIGGVGYAMAAVSVFGFSVAMLVLGLAAGSNAMRLGRAHAALRSPVIGNGLLALAGLLMLAGF